MLSADPLWLKNWMIWDGNLPSRVLLGPYIATLKALINGTRQGVLWTIAILTPPAHVAVIFCPFLRLMLATPEALNRPSKIEHVFGLPGLHLVIATRARPLIRILRELVHELVLLPLLRGPSLILDLPTKMNDFLHKPSPSGPEYWPLRRF